MKKIDFETHFVTKEYVEMMVSNKGYPRYGEDPKTKRRRLYYTPEVAEPLGDPLLNKLLDHGEGRLKAMDAVGIDVQVLSLTSPSVEQLEQEYAGKIKVTKLNAAAGNRMLCAKLRVLGLPSSLFYKDGAEVKRLSGNQPTKKDIEEAIKEVVG